MLKPEFMFQLVMGQGPLENFNWLDIKRPVKTQDKRFQPEPNIQSLGRLLKARPITTCSSNFQV